MIPVFCSHQNIDYYCKISPYASITLSRSQYQKQPNFRPKQTSVFMIAVLFNLVLSSCATNIEYAPIINNSQNLSNIASEQVLTETQNWQPAVTPLETTIPTLQQSPADTDQQPVRSDKTLYSAAQLSNYDYQNLTPSKPLATRHKVRNEQKTKRLRHNFENFIAKQHQHDSFETENKSRTQKNHIISNTNNSSNHRLIKTNTTQRSTSSLKSQQIKKATISINKKMLKLAFQWPIKGIVVKNFRQSKNKGIDIAGNLGQAVYAAEAGKIVYSGRGLIGFGNLLIIKHDPLYLSAYANNSHLVVKEGQSVRKGQVVAQVGRTLSKKKAVLHFEIRKNGKSVDPLRFLPNS